MINTSIPVKYTLKYKTSNQKSKPYYYITNLKKDGFDSLELTLKEFSVTGCLCVWMLEHFINGDNIILFSSRILQILRMLSDSKQLNFPRNIETNYFDNLLNS